MSKNVKNNLRLIGKNKEDIQAISAYSQDSIVSIKDMIFLKKNRIFIMIINRFMWEDVEKGVFRENKRIRCAIKFEGVLKVKSKRVNQKKKKLSLECLAIKCNKILNKNYEIKVFFSGGGIITILAEAIEVIMNDLGEPWNVIRTPKHTI